MTKPILALMFLILAILACKKASPCDLDPAACVTPTAASIESATPSPTPAPRTATPAPEATQSITADVMAAIVRVRVEPDGKPVTPEQYVYAGQSVTVLEYSDDGEWVRIAEPAGWVWRGCVSDNPEHLFCEAAP